MLQPVEEAAGEEDEEDEERGVKVYFSGSLQDSTFKSETEVSALISKYIFKT